MRPTLLSRVVIASAFVASAATAQTATSSFIDDSIPPGANFDKAQFRLWLPAAGGTLRGALILVPGSNGDGRAMAQDTVWQAFAAKNKLAIVACRFTDKPHDQNFIEDYVNVSHGSGQALIDMLGKFGARTQHPELANAPLLFWGMSAGGQFDYEFAAWKPERVAAFVVNKGGIYYTALTPRATREIPALYVLTLVASGLALIANAGALTFRSSLRTSLLVVGLASVVGLSLALLFSLSAPWRGPLTVSGHPIDAIVRDLHTGFFASQ